MVSTRNVLHFLVRSTKRGYSVRYKTNNAIRGNKDKNDSLEPIFAPLSRSVDLRGLSPLC